MLINDISDRSFESVCLNISGHTKGKALVEATASRVSLRGLEVQLLDRRKAERLIHFLLVLNSHKTRSNGAC